MTTKPKMSRYQELMNRAESPGMSRYQDLMNRDLAGVSNETPEPVATIPNAKVTVVHTDKRSGVRTIEIKCPHCPKTHTHGWPLSDPEGSPIGHRSAHCSDGNKNRGYNIIQTQEVK